MTAAPFTLRPVDHMTGQALDPSPGDDGVPVLTDEDADAFPGFGQVDDLMAWVAGAPDLDESPDAARNRARWALIEAELDHDEAISSAGETVRNALAGFLADDEPEPFDVSGTVDDVLQAVNEAEDPKAAAVAAIEAEQAKSRPRKTLLAALNLILSADPTADPTDANQTEE